MTLDTVQVFTAYDKYNTNINLVFLLCQRNDKEGISTYVTAQHESDSRDHNTTRSSQGLTHGGGDLNDLGVVVLASARPQLLYRWEGGGVAFSSPI